MKMTTCPATVVSAGLITILLLASVLPLVARSQSLEEESPQPTIFDDDAPAVTETSPYVIETIPGGEEVTVGDFVIGPGKVELELNPGESKIVEILVTNRIGTTKTFSLSTEDATGSQDPSQTVVLLGDKRGPYTLKDYLTFPAETFVLKNGQRARIPVTVSIPPNAEPGGRYGSVLTQVVTKPAVAGQTNTTVPQSAIIARIGTLFFVTVPGDIAHEGSLKDFSTIPDKSWFQSGPIRFQILFENTGTIHMSPYGELVVTNMFGEEVGHTDIDPWFVFPQALRFREIVWDREQLFGKYTATININRGYDNTIDTMSVSFWVIPWKLVLGVFIGLFIFFYLVRMFFNTFEFKRKIE